MSTETTRRYTPPPPGIQAAAVALHDMDHYCDGVEGCAAEFLPHARKALAAALDVEEMARAAYEHGRSTAPAPTRKRMQPWGELTESAREPYLARVCAIRAAILGESHQQDPVPSRCDQPIAMQGYDAVPCERDSGHRGIHWSNAELTATAPEPAHASGGIVDPQAEASVRSLGDDIRTFAADLPECGPLTAAILDGFAERAHRLERERDKAIAERDEVLAVLDSGPVRPCCSRGPGGIHTCGGWEGGDRG